MSCLHSEKVMRGERYHAFTGPIKINMLIFYYQKYEHLFAV